MTKAILVPYMHIVTMNDSLNIEHSSYHVLKEFSGNPEADQIAYAASGNIRHSPQYSNSKIVYDPLEDYIDMYLPKPRHVKSSEKYQPPSFTVCASNKIWNLSQIVEWIDTEASHHVLMQNRHSQVHLYFSTQDDRAAFLEWYERQSIEYMHIPYDGDMCKLEAWLDANTQCQYQVMRTYSPSGVRAAFRDPSDAMLFKLTWDRDAASTT